MQCVPVTVFRFREYCAFFSRKYRAHQKHISRSQTSATDMVRTKSKKAEKPFYKSLLPEKTSFDMRIDEYAKISLFCFEPPQKRPFLLTFADGAWHKMRLSFCSLSLSSPFRLGRLLQRPICDKPLS